MRAKLIIFSLLMYTCFFTANIVLPADTMSEIEWNSDRYGHDFSYLDLDTSDPTICEEACSNRIWCMAWTYIKPNTVQGPLPRCWLKNAIPPSRPSSHTVSGTKKIIETKTENMVIRSKETQQGIYVKMASAHSETKDLVNLPYNLYSSSSAPKLDRICQNVRADFLISDFDPLTLNFSDP